MPSDGSWASLPKTTVKHDHGQERSDDGPGRANHRLLVADRDVTPRQHLEQFAITPQIEPVVAFGAAALDDELIMLTVSSRQPLATGIPSRPAFLPSTFPAHLIAFARSGAGPR